MKLTRHIGNCDIVPRGWGLAWKPYDRAGFVLMPIPINIIARVVRLIHARWLLAPWVNDSAELALYSVRIKARRDGFDEGYQAGIKACRGRVVGAVGGEEGTNWGS